MQRRLGELELNMMKCVSSAITITQRNAFETRMKTYDSKWAVVLSASLLVTMKLSLFGRLSYEAISCRYHCIECKFSLHHIENVCHVKEYSE